MPIERTLSERARLHRFWALVACAMALPACSGDFGGWDLFSPARADAGVDALGGAEEDRSELDAHRGSIEATVESGGPTDASMVESGVFVDVAADVVAAPEASDAASDVAAGDSADAGRDAGVVGPGGPLDGQRWELPCGRTLQSGLLCENTSPLGKDCPGGPDPIRRTVTFGGSPGTFYDVELRVRGVVEPKSYQGGSSRSGRIYVGGVPTPSVHNVYGFRVSSPSEIYYVNAEQGEPSRVVVLDATTTVTIEGGATVELFVADSDCAMVRNCIDPSSNTCAPHVVPGIPPAPAPFDGQFVQVNVISVGP